MWLRGSRSYSETRGNARWREFLSLVHQQGMHGCKRAHRTAGAPLVKCEYCFAQCLLAIWYHTFLLISKHKLWLSYFVDTHSAVWVKLSYTECRYVVTDSWSVSQAFHFLFVCVNCELMLQFPLTTLLAKYKSSTRHFSSSEASCLLFLLLFCFFKAP